jgi:hypothetical protein
MTFFESLLLLLLAAISLLQVARRLSRPYPAMLAGARVIVALIPGGAQRSRKSGYALSKIKLPPPDSPSFSCS